MRIPAAIFAACLCLCLTAAARTDTPKPTGVIRGTVVDEHGVPVEKAVVRVTPMGRPLAYMSPWAETDAQGRFAIRNLDWGQYASFAGKESEGYPEGPFSFYQSGGKFPMIILSPASPEAEVQIQFAPKAGILTGRVSDSVTGAPIKAAFDLSQADTPNSFISMGEPSSYRILLPASETIDIAVSAPGYQTAHFPAFNLSSGERETLDIQLQPSGERFYVDARGPTSERRIRQTTGPNPAPTASAKESPLKLEMIVADRPLHMGATVPVWFTITNTGTEPLTIPISPNSADVEPADSHSGYSFQELFIRTREDEDSRYGGPTLGILIALYGDPSSTGTTRTLYSGDALVVLADLQIKPAGAPPLGVSYHSLNASASLEKVTVRSGKGVLTESSVEVAHTESPLFDYQILPPN